MPTLVKRGTGSVLVQTISPTKTDEVILNTDIFAEGISAFGGVVPETKWYSSNNVTDVLKNLIQKVHGITTQPSVTLSLDNYWGFEYGTDVDLTIPLIITYSEGNYEYGPATGVTFLNIQLVRILYLGTDVIDSQVVYTGVPVSTYSDVFTYNEAPAGLDFDSVKYEIVATHTEGVVPVDVNTDDDPLCQIIANVTEHTITIPDYRKIFSISDEVLTEPVVDTDIKGVYDEICSVPVFLNDTFTVIIPIGTRRISIAIPVEMNKTPQIMYNAYLSAPDTYSVDCDYYDMFVTKVINIGGYADLDPIPYTIYTYITEVPFEVGGRFVITLQLNN